MKLFGNNPIKIIDYLKQPIINNETELEVAFGSSPYKNPIDKKTFLRVLEDCKKTYKKLSETVDLDIRTDYRGKPSNVRCSIHGLDSIKRYCKEASLENITNMEYIQKKNNKDFPQLKDENYNVRLNCKNEVKLSDTHYFVKSFLKDYDNKGKHYRYKKRFSFITDDKLFRIDLTIVKATNYFRGKYDFQKTFRKANILKNKETYELEIEYIGWEKEVGVKAIDDLFKKTKEEKEMIQPGIFGNGNMYDPLNLGIKIDETFTQSNFDEEPSYDFDSPRFDSDPNPTLRMRYTESSIRYTEEDYRELIGKATMITKSYFEENKIDMNVYNTLVQYYEMGKMYGIIKDVYEEINEKTGEYVDTLVKVSLYPQIGTYNELIVPLKDIIGGYYDIREDVISSRMRKTDLFYKKDERGNLEYVDKLSPDPLTPSEEGPTYAPDSPRVSSEGPTYAPDSPPGSNESGNSPQSPRYEPPDFDPDDDQSGGAPKNSIDLLAKELLIILEKHVIYISKVVYNTSDLMSYKLKEDIIEQYKKLTRQRTKYFTFVGPQPISLNKGNINTSNPNNIIMDFAVTEKADGERYELMILNNIGYLINAKQEVINTGCSFQNIQGVWLFDGEYITKDRYNEPINKYMIFDVYWCDIKGKGIPKEAHTLPFITRDSLDVRSRKYILDWFTGVINIKPRVSTIIKFGDNPIDVGVKTYDFGYQSENPGEVIEASKLGTDKYMQIFKASKNILKKDKEDYYSYRIDGLIFLPTRLSVRGSVEGVPSKKISGTWMYNYKWKEPKENTIDFLVKFNNDIKNGVRSEIVKPFVDMRDGVKIVGEYKKADLYVGYKEIDDENIDYCMKILTNSERSTEVIQRFNINSGDEEKYNTTNIPLDDGRALCDSFEREEIHDGDLVEMRFNPEAKNGMYWEPIRVRKDKLKPQYFTAANNIWNTIRDPITEDIITGKDFTKGKQKINNEGLYYIDRSDDFLPESNALRKFHNYIKSRLISGISTTFNGRIRVMDMSCGRGGDIHKYLETGKVSFLFGIDISSNVSEACKRFYSENNRDCKPLFVRGDTSKNIKTRKYCNVEDGDKKQKEHCEIMTNIIYGNKVPLSKEYVNVSKSYAGLATRGFDLISSQFSLHYYFKNESTLKGFIQNLVENIKKGGYFIGTCYDGKSIFDYFKKVEEYNFIEESSSEEERDSDDSSSSEEEDLIDTEEDGNLKYELKVNEGKNMVFKIEKKYEIDNFDYNPEDTRNMLGNVIDVYMDSIGQNIPEYLVNFDYFIDIMAENGFVPVTPTKIAPKYSTIFRKDNFDERGLGEFSSIISKIPEIERTDKDFNTAFKGAKGLYTEYSSNPMARLSSFNKYFIFQKK